ncbi:MAG: TIGR01212 family radical SAM protein [Lachnospiraceae bacterium]|nr:TIGR01212 family radical SAM protein [Lachnospiraceae bacterium]
MNTENKIPYYSLNNYLKDTFSMKVYKVSVDGGFTCPNRDGKIDTRGCIFCSAGGSGEFAQSRSMSITEQINAGKKLILNKLPKNKPFGLIAYFQAFTNTYADIRTLTAKYEEAINHPEVVAVSIATRPDCINEEIVALLSKLNKKKPIWVELGLQTIHEETAKYIRRGYSLDVFEKAVSMLKRAEVEIITHVILGLPKESKNQMLETVEYVGKSGSTGIKLQLLHVLKETDLEKEYITGNFEVLSEQDYVNLVCDSVKLLPPHMVIHRMTGDGDKKLLVAPLWSADKKHVINELSKYLYPVSKNETNS